MSDRHAARSDSEDTYHDRLFALWSKCKPKVMQTIPVAATSPSSAMVRPISW